jgi:DNA-binding phage protein
MAGNGDTLTIVRYAVKAIVGLCGEVPKQEHLDAVAAAVAAQFRKERLRRRMSMNAVAEKGGISQQMVSYVERSIRNPTLDTMLRMASALDADLANLIAEALRQSRRSR